MQHYTDLTNLITDYIHASNDFEQIEESEYENYEGGQMAVMESTYLLPLTQLRAWDTPAQSEEEALKATNLAVVLRDQFDAEPAVYALEQAAKAYKRKAS